MPEPTCTICATTVYPTRDVLVTELLAGHTEDDTFTIDTTRDVYYCRECYTRDDRLN